MSEQKRIKEIVTGLALAAGVCTHGWLTGNNLIAHSM
jgi:hypothetical protein